MKDPEFLKDAKLQGLIVDPMTGEALTDMLASVYRTPKDVVPRRDRRTGHCAISSKALDG